MVPFRVDRRKGMRYLRIVVNELNQVVLKVPHRVAEKTALNFLKKQGDWVVQAMERAGPPQQLWDYLEAHPEVSALGKRCKVELIPRNGSMLYAWRRSLRVVRFFYDSKELREAQLKAAIWAFAKEVLTERVIELAARVNAKPTRITIRDQRTRWGSCASNGGISLNWRLVLLDPKIQDYVIYHELAHLKEMNHSRRFWRRLQEYDAPALIHDRELTKCSQAMMRLGR